LDWAWGLRKRQSARRAVKWGGIVCLIIATLVTIAGIAKVSLSGKTTGHAIVWMIGFSLPQLVVAIAGVRLLRGAGRISGTLASILLVVDLVIMSTQPMSSVLAIALAIRIALFLIVLNGVRGAFALRFCDYTSELEDTFR
jgi:hypothetical protein